jgi:riboflavin kinase/FMN adenylyltransferase
MAVDFDGARVARLVAEGRIAEAHVLAGHPFEYTGVVQHGEKRGRALGFPTANLDGPEGTLVPPDGIYAGFAGGVAAAINVGVRPQFDSSLGRLLEAHLLDFDGDLYGQVLRVQFLHRLRDEIRFGSVDALIQQIRLDVMRVRTVLRHRPAEPTTTWSDQQWRQR